jgi:hypothetical protein
LKPYVLIAFLLLTSSCSQQQSGEVSGGDSFGNISFPISCSADSQKRFNRAVSMLHSFQYPDTVDAFSDIARREPSCAMAFWGIAISLRPNPLVGPVLPEEQRRGREALQMAELAEQKTAREREWINALSQFYDDDKVSDEVRTKKYEEAMLRLHERYPDDAEAAVFYALALNEAADPADKTYARQLKAAVILEGLQSKYPNHPGIPHYIIHSYDQPSLAMYALIAASRCSQLAPSAPHALHMPSHIFSTLGMWDQVVTSELKADEATVQYIRQRYHESEISIDAEPSRYHSYDFLINAYLQLVQDKKAQQIVEKRAHLRSFPSTFRYTGHTAYAAIPVRYALERGNWAEAADLQIPDTPFPQAAAITWFGRALGSARSGDRAKAAQALEHIKELKEELSASHDTYWAGQVEIQQQGAGAWLAFLEGRPDEAVRLLKSAAASEDVTSKSIAMENRLVPMRELLGELLLEEGRPAEALDEFERSLSSDPNRYRSFVGAARAAAELNDQSRAKLYYGKIVDLAWHADTSRPDLLKARDALSDH